MSVENEDTSKGVTDKTYDSILFYILHFMMHVLVDMFHLPEFMTCTELYSNYANVMFAIGNIYI